MPVWFEYSGEMREGLGQGRFAVRDKAGEIKARLSRTQECGL